MMDPQDLVVFMSTVATTCICLLSYLTMQYYKHHPLMFNIPRFKVQAQRLFFARECSVCQVCGDERANPGQQAQLSLLNPKNVISILLVITEFVQLCAINFTDSWYDTLPPSPTCTKLVQTRPYPSPTMHHLASYNKSSTFTRLHNPIKIASKPFLFEADDSEYWTVLWACLAFVAAWSMLVMLTRSCCNPRHMRSSKPARIFVALLGALSKLISTFLYFPIVRTLLSPMACQYLNNEMVMRYDIHTRNRATLCFWYLVCIYSPMTNMTIANASRLLALF